MNIQEDMRISGCQPPVVGPEDMELRTAFDMWIKEFGHNNIPFICSMVYNLGRVHGIREERSRRKEGKRYGNKNY